jgi:two-component system, response regulator YesN
MIGVFQLLIVDDEPLIREGLEKMISWETYGLEVVGLMTNGEEALNYLQNHTVDIIITDIKMPHMDGLTLMQRCMELGYTIRFIILSGYADFDLVKRAVKMGVENYLVKPVDEEELNQTLLQLVENLNHESANLEKLREGTRILRDNIVWRWMTGNISADEMRERKEYLEFNLKKNYQVAVIHIKENKKASLDSRENLLLLGQHLEAYISSQGYAIGLYTINFIYLMFPLANINEMAIQKTLEHVASMIREQTCFSFLISVGNIQENPFFLYKSYHQAMVTMENAVFYSKREILFYKDSKQDMSIYAESAFNEVMKLENNSDWTDNVGVFQVIDNIMEILEQTEGNKKEMVQSFAAIVVAKVFHSILLMNRSLESDIKQLEERLPEVYDLVYIDDISSWMKDIVLLAMKLSEREEEKYSLTIATIVNYLKQNYDREISLKTVADEFNMNSVYLGRLFKAETGSAFTDYINNMRVKKAKKLLAETEMTMKQVAEKVGYLNINYFFPVFKRNVGISPTEYRKHVRDGER